jgi:hypothetical protein
MYLASFNYCSIVKEGIDADAEKEFVIVEWVFIGNRECSIAGARSLPLESQYGSLFTITHLRCH